MNIQNNVFKILEEATRQEKAGNRVEAATKYYEATYLLRRLLAETPQDAIDTRRLLEKKIAEYSMLASRLYFCEGRMEMATTMSRGGDFLSSDSERRQRSIFQHEVSCHKRQEATSPEYRRRTHGVDADQITSEANKKLTSAVNLDEGGKYQQAIQSYMESAELYIISIRMYEDRGASSSTVKVLKRRLGGILDRVEQLKVSK